MSFRTWVSIVTFILIAVIIFFSRHEILRAWHLLGQVNIWILLLLIPGQILSYFAVGEMIFSYLRAKGSIKDIPKLSLARMALEMNFVNHILPSGGVSGVSYMTWRLGQYGVSPGRATMAQVVRFAVGFAAFIVLLVVAVLVVTIDGEINRWIILVSATMVGLMIGGMVLLIFLVSNRSRMERFGAWLTRLVNRIVRKLTFGKRQRVLARATIVQPLTEIHEDYIALRKDKKILVKPFIWGIIFTLVDAGLFMITFWALGHPVNPAPILIAFGAASIAGFIMVTPGGAGAYEAVMVAFLAVAGLPQDVAIAGIVLTRVILLLGTIVLGYVFYQHALIKYGKKSSEA